MNKFLVIAFISGIAFFAAVAEASSEPVFISKVCMNGRCYTSSYSSGTSIQTSIHVVCRNGQCTINGQPWDGGSSDGQVTCPTGQCLYSGKCYLPGANITSNNQVLECVNGQWKTVSGICAAGQCRYDNICYSSGQEITNSSGTYRCSNENWVKVDTACDCDYRGRCYEEGGLITYDRMYYKCMGDDEWERQCSSFRGEAYFTGEEVTNSKGERWLCENSKWRKIGCSDDYCFYNTKCYADGKAVWFNSKYNICDDGEWDPCYGCPHKAYCYSVNSRIVWNGYNWRCGSDYRWTKTSSTSSGASCWNAKEQRWYEDGEIWTSPESGDSQRCDDGGWVYV